MFQIQHVRQREPRTRPFHEPCLTSSRFVRLRGVVLTLPPAFHKWTLTYPRLMLARLRSATRIILGLHLYAPSRVRCVVLSNGADAIAHLIPPTDGPAAFPRQAHGHATRQHPAKKHSTLQLEQTGYQLLLCQQEHVSTNPESHEPALPDAIGRDRHLHVSLAKPVR
jgi:hypothetical protein